MRKFECRRCAKTCTLLLDENLAIPRSCIYGNRESLWCAIKEDSAKNEQFGKTEQFPDWVKVGAVGYDTEHKRYFKVLNILEDFIDIEYIDADDKYYSLTYSHINEHTVQVHKRPFNADEMKALVGKVVGWENNLELVISYNAADGDVYVDQMWCSAKYLMDNEYTIDGKPCYKLEHLNEKGEWVE